MIERVERRGKRGNVDVKGIRSMVGSGVSCSRKSAKRILISVDRSSDLDPDKEAGCGLVGPALLDGHLDRGWACVGYKFSQEGLDCGGLLGIGFSLLQVGVF